MKSKLLHENDGQRTFALIFDLGDEVMGTLKDFARQKQLTAAQFTAIGAFSDAVLAYFDWQKREYQKFKVDEQVEVLMMGGDVSQSEDGTPKVHAHIVLGRQDTSTRGGHLMEAHVRPTLEVIVTDSPSHLRRKHDERSGLSLIQL